MALDVHQQSILRNSGPFVKPRSTLEGVELCKDKGITCAMSSANNKAQKKRSKDPGRRTLGLSPRTPLPSVQHQTTSTSGPAAQECRGLQKSKSGAGKHPKSSFWEMHRINPPSTPAQKDRQVSLSGRRHQSSQAESKGTRPRDQGGVGNSGSNQSSSHHKRMNQGQESSASLGPHRPTPVATATLGALAANTLDQASGGMSGQSGQQHRQPEEQEQVMAQKVR